MGSEELRDGFPQRSGLRPRSPPLVNVPRAGIVAWRLEAALTKSCDESQHSKVRRAKSLESLRILGKSLALFRAPLQIRGKSLLNRRKSLKNRGLEARGVVGSIFLKPQFSRLKPYLPEGYKLFGPSNVIMGEVASSRPGWPSASSMRFTESIKERPMRIGHCVLVLAVCGSASVAWSAEE